ncbi:MAG: hypothetical protein NC920_03515 [Candidatus Omnitrophica bacterium]|nr:hypothetical protein [Candidatus Omnitrophota bacterium]MCM8798538.1 hypothetical protein [Candidatus Omnitrophota bacterium]
MQRYLLFFFFLILFTGCASFPIQKTSPDKPLESASLLKFSDVPVPQGFRLIANESFIFQNENGRVGLLRYAGSPTADQAVNFYRQQMPVNGWFLLNVIEYGRRVLNFEKGEETCIITIEPATTKTLVSISLGPKSKSSPSLKKNESPNLPKDSTLK